MGGAYARNLNFGRPCQTSAAGHRPLVDWLYSILTYRPGLQRQQAIMVSTKCSPLLLCSTDHTYGVVIAVGGRLHRSCCSRRDLDSGYPVPRASAAGSPLTEFTRSRSRRPAHADGSCGARAGQLRPAVTAQGDEDARALQPQKRNARRAKVESILRCRCV